MKNLIAAVLFLGSANALALAIGDTATYNISATNGASVEQFTQKVELTAYDKTAKEYTVTMTLSNAAGDSKVLTNAVKEENFYTDDELSQIVGFCDQEPISGVSKKVTINLAATAAKPAATVTVDACEVPTQGDKKGTTDIAAVPFGTVKTDYVTAKGAHVVIDLIAAHAGAPAAAAVKPTQAAN